MPWPLLRLAGVRRRPQPTGRRPTLKWKVAAAADGLERRLLERLLDWLPADARLRLDANGGLGSGHRRRLGGPAGPEIDGWTGWSSPSPRTTRKDSSGWRSGSRWPSTNPCALRPAAAGQLGVAGRCGVPPRRATPAPC